MRIVKRTLLVVVLAVVVYAVQYAWRALPIISGYGAKDLCSCVFVAHREAADVVAQELGSGLLSLGTFEVHPEDSSATGRVFGLARRKAIYRPELGCTLVAGLDEATLRAQRPALAAHPAILADTLPWPQGNRITDSLPANIDLPALKQVVASAFDEPGPKKTRRTRAIVVVYDGKLIYEQYAPGFDAQSRHIGWSMTKSITNALLGILVGKGKLQVNAAAPVAAWAGDDRHQITLNDLMHASSGLDWEENYGGPSGATNMLFKTKDMGRYAADVPLKHKPGTVFQYSSGTTNILSRIVRDQVGDEAYYRFPYESLFHKIGMYSAVLEPDAGGTFVGSSYSFATARDFARFGLLYLNDGVWQGERILPEGWVAYTRKAAPAAPMGEYGAQFWLNAGAPGQPAKRLYPDVPADLYWADGYEGQNVFILPSKKLVVAKLSLSQNGEYLDDNAFLSALIQTIHD